MNVQVLYVLYVLFKTSRILPKIYKLHLFYVSIKIRTAPTKISSYANNKKFSITYKDFTILKVCTYLLYILQTYISYTIEKCILYFIQILHYAAWK